MNYRRALVVLELDRDLHPSLAALSQLAPHLEHLVVIALLPARAFGWLNGEASHEPGDAVGPALAALQGAAQGVVPTATVRVVPGLSDEAVGALVAHEHLELVVAGSTARRVAEITIALRRRGLAVLVPHGAAREGPAQQLVCFVRDPREGAAVRPFLRDHSGPATRVTLVTPAERLPPDEVARIVEVAGISARVELVHTTAGSIARWLDAWTPAQPVDLIVVARISHALLEDPRWPAAVLLLPPVAFATRAGRALDVMDAVDDGGPLRVRVGISSLVGDVTPLPDQPLAFVSGGKVTAHVTSRAGEAELPPGLGVHALGVWRAAPGAEGDPTAEIEQRIAVVAPGTRPLIVFDADLPIGALRTLGELEGPPAPELLAVRLRPSIAAAELRARLADAGLARRVVDARAVLDEGEALDVSAELDGVRLMRVGQRLRRAGFPVTAIVRRGPVQPELEPLEDEYVAPLIAGNRVTLELDNATARRWLLETIASAQRSVLFQVYMALDDDVGQAVEAALTAAAARGVDVKVLVDSLHGQHGSFGVRNPLLERLSAAPGIALRVSQPITELPSLTALKRRDHRKLVVVDGALALLGGRNLSHEYYTPFDEVTLTPSSQWRTVPWLDAGARVEGPAVGALATSFRDAWVEAGGAPMPVVTPEAVGPTAARVVVHRGLRDVRTLETYLGLIASARSHLYTVNGFPLALELQHALLKALRRGVRVCALLGHLSPTFGDGQVFKGPWSMARATATEFVHSRYDPLVAEGAEVWHFAVPPQPSWAEDVGAVHPHVHAKVMSVDGKRCTVGSANLDITAAYWESELLLVVEDEGLAGGCEARIAQLMSGATRVQRDDPTWKELARRRAWMRHWPGMLSV